MPKPRRTQVEMQAIRDQQAYDKQEKKEKQEQALKNAADIEDEQRATSNAHKPQVASFRPPPSSKLNLAEDEIDEIETNTRTFMNSS